MNKIFTLLLLAASGVSYANYSNQYNNNTYNNAQYGNSTFHQDPRYMYNYRLGNSGSYTYNYDVEYMDGLGVYGNCDMTGKHGDCTIVNEGG